MKETIRKKLLKILHKNTNASISYSQCGEDLIVKFLLNSLGIRKPTYLDIGAHHASYLSNTALFYQCGSKGICVEPDPVLFQAIAAARPRDTCLNVGVGADDSSPEADFYLMTASTLNTFSRAEAEACEKSDPSQKIEKIIRLPVLSVAEIMKKTCAPTPDFMSIDVEGMDMDILKSIDFTSFRPAVICVEVLDYVTQEKDANIHSLMESVGYVEYANTYINAIFVDRQRWK